MKSITFAAIGDSIIDKYTIQKKNFLGGTAVNSAFAAKKAGAKSYIISAIGKDGAGKAFQKAFISEGIRTTYLQKLKDTTSTLDIFLKNADSPEYSNWELGVLKEFCLGQKAKDFLQKADIAKIMLFWPMRDVFNDFASLKLPNTTKVGDFSGVSQYTEGIDVMKKYISGFDILVKSIDKNDKKSVEYLKNLAKKYDKIIVGLVGEKGSMVFTKNSIFSHPSIPTKVVDTNGAGDAYLATFAVIYKKSRNILLSMMEGTKAAQKMITHFGGTGYHFTA